MLQQRHSQSLLRSSFVLAAVAGIFFSTPAWAAPGPVSVLLQINRVAGSSTGASGNSGDLGPALLGYLNQPEGVTVDGGGNLYIADTMNNRIQRMDAATGVISTIVASGQLGYSGDSGPATDSLLNEPAGVLVDRSGNLYIADTGNHIVRFVSATTGIITTVAGTAYATGFNPNSIGDGGPATLAEMSAPTAIAVDAAGNLYIADAGNNRVREVSAATGIISTVAGTGIAGYTGDNVQATQSELNNPTGIALDAAGNLYIADSSNNLIRKVTAMTGVITTVAGIPGSSGYNGDSILATLATLSFPTGIAVDLAGHIYFSDRDNSRIRWIDNSGNIKTLAGNGVPGFEGDGALATDAEVDAPDGLALDSEGDLYVADSGNNVLRVVSQGRGFPAAAIATNSPETHNIYLGLNQSTILSAPTISPAQLETQQGLQGPTQPQEYTVGAVTGCSADGVTVNPPGSICTVPVTFVPGYPGMRTGAVVMTANSAAISFGLHGIGLGPQAVVVPGIIQTILYSTDMYNGTPLSQPEQIAVDPAGNVYVA